MTNLMATQNLESRLVVVGGVSLCVRGIRPDDEPALRAAFAQLSPSARYARFRGVGTPSDAQWRYLADVDGERHVAMVAIDPAGEIVGVARFVCGRELGQAEVAFTIADKLQRMGLGRILLETLLPLARSRGVNTLVAYTSAENQGMVRLFLSRGGRHVSTHQGEAVLTLPTASGTPPCGATTTSRTSTTSRTRSTRWSFARIAARARNSARMAWRRAARSAA